MDHDTVVRTSLIRSVSDAGASVFETILTRSPISRIDIARQTGLSQAAVTKAVAPLVAVGLVDASPAPQRDGTPGRPMSPVSIVRESIIMLGVKVNGDEIIAVATDLATTILASERRALASPDPHAVVAAIVGAISALEAALGDRAPVIGGIGVSVSGVVDVSTGVVRESNLMGWVDVPLRSLLSGGTTLPVTVMNDVHALMIREGWFGMGLGAASFAIVTIGPGVDSGLYLNGGVVSGAFGVAGAIGHLALASPAIVCACGRRGCVEAAASTSAIELSVTAALGRPVGIAEVVSLANAGEPAAVTALREAALLIGRAIATLVNLTGPEVVIVGSEFVSGFALSERTLRDAFEMHAFGAAVDARIVARPQSLEDWARGAAATAIQALVC